jgi:hypothetical protein
LPIRSTAEVLQVYNMLHLINIFIVLSKILFILLVPPEGTMVYWIATVALYSEGI